MTDTPVASPAAVEAAVAAIDAWIDRWSADGSFLVHAERQPVTDGTASWQWHLRFRGEERESITVWATLNQRTLHTEVQLMEAPEENVEAIFSYLLGQNAGLYGMAYALGPEGALYLVGRTAVVAVDEASLDRIFGTAVVAVDAAYPNAMALAYPGRFRRHPRRRG